MINASYENINTLLDTGFKISFVTLKHNAPLHWHVPLEIIYILNGNATVHLDSETHLLNPLDLLVIDSSRAHDVIYNLPQTMGIQIHISKNYMRKFIPDLEFLKIDCVPKGMEAHKRDAYFELCKYLKELTILYVEQPITYDLRSNALLLQILACLVENFSTPQSDTHTVDVKNVERMEHIAKYVQAHYKENISLQDVAKEMGLNKEYFCRFFKKNTGVSFVTYLNQIRMNHVYADIINTDDSMGDILERHGCYNQKIFYKMFKELYGCTPRQLRGVMVGNPFISQP